MDKSMEGTTASQTFNLSLSNIKPDEKANDIVQFIREKFALPEYNQNRRIDVRQWVRDKNGLSYVPWGKILELFKERYPFGFCQIAEDSPKKDDTGGWWVVTELQLAPGLPIYKEKYPILDFKNKPIANPQPDQVNKSNMRARVKHVAIETGIGAALFQHEALDDIFNIQDRELEDYEWIFKELLPFLAEQGMDAYKALKLAFDYYEGYRPIAEGKKRIAELKNKTKEQ